MIERLETRKELTVTDCRIGSDNVCRPTYETMEYLPSSEEMFNKINEIIDYINGREEKQG